MAGRRESRRGRKACAGGETGRSADHGNEVVDRLLEALIEGDGRFPAQPGFRQGDVRLALDGVVLREGLLDDLGVSEAPTELDAHGYSGTTSTTQRSPVSSIQLK